GFSKTSSVSTLQRHLDKHSIIAPKKQKTLHEYHNDPHTQTDQKNRDEAVIKWIICDLQSINVVENEEWRTMISTFDSRYRFHNGQTIHDTIISRYEEQKNKVKISIQQIIGKVSLTSDMWTASNNKAFLSLTIHYVDDNWKLNSFLLDIIPMLE
ncbi:18507_t:CDS:1, partial [Entrophospora sp. SA101]